MKQKSAKNQISIINLFGEAEVKSGSKKIHVATKKVGVRAKEDMTNIGLSGIKDFGEWIKNNRGNKTL